MKIFVKSRKWIENNLEFNPEWHRGKYIISIFGSYNQSPFSQRFNVLQLKFDDVTEKDEEGIHFNKEMAKQIINFIKDIEDKPIYVHCDAGISRSGAIGYMLNEWFNKFIEINKEDNKFFLSENSHIMPNPEVVRILKNEMFGYDYN